MYIGVKELISKYKKPFNRQVKAKQKAKSRLREIGKKATEKEVEAESLLVIAEWDKKADFGVKVHQDITRRRIKKYPGSILGTYKKAEGDVELPSEEINKLEINQRYYEKMLVDNQNMIIGYADEIHVDEKGYINIQDFKSFKEVRRTYTAKAANGFTIVENFFYPVNSLVDCNFIEAALQASFYMYIAWTYNKRLKPGKITMLYTKLDEETGNIINEELIDLPYLIEEVKAIIRNQKEIK